MNEIAKMYKNVGAKKLLYCDICKAQEHALGLCAETKCEPFYPPFTAEKQIELIKWLVKHRFNFMVYELTEKDFTFEVINKRLKQTSQFVSLSENNFEEGLAKVLNCFWQDLTPEEKQQIKEILK